MRSAGLCCPLDAQGQWTDCTAQYNKPSCGLNYEYANYGKTCVHGIMLQVPDVSVLLAIPIHAATQIQT
ncbi:hypothetical protein CHS0354_013736, partial [Potamilus streckersoni]